MQKLVVSGPPETTGSMLFSAIVAQNTILAVNAIPNILCATGKDGTACSISWLKVSAKRMSKAPLAKPERMLGMTPPRVRRYFSEEADST